MKWSMDTHKFMSEITRKALQIIVSHGITSESEPEEIEAVERELASSKVYKDFEGARGRVRRALFTYFKAYGCLDENEHLTEMGHLFAENKITVQEFCFHYVLNYHYKDDDSDYYPVQLLLLCIKKLSTSGAGQGYLSDYDFSRIIDCQSIDQIDDAFISSLIAARSEAPVGINDRAIGYDVWSNILQTAGIFRKTTNHTLILSNQYLADWILSAYNHPLVVDKGAILTGVFKYLPILSLYKPNGNADVYTNEGKALQAFLFDNIEDRIIEKYIFTAVKDGSFSEMLKTLGLNATSKSFYQHFFSLEHLIGYCLAGNADNNIRIIGSIIASVELTDAEMTEVMPHEIIVNHDNDERLPNGSNILLYGVPGSGKSWTIEHEYCPAGSHVERLVFHPDYTNSDFIGQILPVVDKNNDNQVTYEFSPGPFATILRDAYANPQQKFVLIIEELNRGNAPAIFGDVFQLLDRMVEEKTVDGVTYPIGTSEYAITNKNVAEIVYHDASHKIRVPSNLTLLATMNTSDQNVFTLDTAFQRRWKMRLIENSFENVRPSLANCQILDTGVTWRRFCETINKQIVGNRAKMASSEDKRLGVYFVHESDLKYNDADTPINHDTIHAELNELLRAEMDSTISNEQKNRLQEIRNALVQNRIFPEKVIKYLWDDAFKFNPGAVFDTEENKNLDSLESVIRMFVYENRGRNRFEIFKSQIRDLLYES